MAMNNSSARLAGIMALIELLQQYNMIGVAVHVILSAIYLKN